MTLDLAIQYREARDTLRALRTLNADEGERRKIADMIDDCEYVLEWLETGRCPDDCKRAARPYRVRLWDPAWLTAVDVVDPCGRGDDAGFGGRQRPEAGGGTFSLLERLLASLSERERQCLVMHYGDGMTLDEIASALSVGKSSVQTYLARGMKKARALAR